MDNGSGFEKYFYPVCEDNSISCIGKTVFWVCCDFDLYFVEVFEVIHFTVDNTPYRVSSIDVFRIRIEAFF